MVLAAAEDAAVGKTMEEVVNDAKMVVVVEHMEAFGNWLGILH